MVFEPNRRYLEDEDADAWARHFEREGRDVWVHRDRLLAAAALRPGLVVVDLGAGTGAFTRLIADAVTETGRVHAVEPTAHFRRRLDALAVRAGNVSVHADVAELPADSADLVFCVDTYHHLERPQPVLRRARAALRREGRLLLADLIRDASSPAWLLDHVRADQPQVERELADVGFEVQRRFESLDQNYVLALCRTEFPPM